MRTPLGRRRDMTTRRYVMTRNGGRGGSFVPRVPSIHGAVWPARAEAHPAIHCCHSAYPLVAGTAAVSAGVVSDARVSHPASVIPLVAQLRRRIARRSLGMRVLLCLLVMGVLVAGAPAGVLHAHVDGDHGHNHELADAGDELPAQPDTGETPSTLHFHEATSVAQALPDLVAAPLASLPPLGWHASQPDTGPRLTPRTPPHRPPIA